MPSPPRSVAALRPGYQPACCWWLLQVWRLGACASPGAAVWLGHCHHGNAIDRAGWYTKFAARALIIHDHMHLFGRTEDGIDRAGLDAQGAADAPGFVDHSQGSRCFKAVGRIQRQGGLTHESRQPLDALGSAGWTLIDCCRALGHRDRVGMAVRVSAAGALRLRQGRINRGDQEGPVFQTRFKRPSWSEPLAQL